MLVVVRLPRRCNVRVVAVREDLSSLAGLDWFARQDPAINRWAISTLVAKRKTLSASIGERAG